VRLSFLKALVDEKFEYDCSNPSRSGLKTPFFPYTLDYGGQRGQDCAVPPCIKDDQIYPGFWEVLMNDLKSEYTVKQGENILKIERECASAAGCILFNEDNSVNYEPSADQIYELFLNNFNRFYNGNKAPFPLYLSEDWIQNEGKRKGLMKFIEEISKQHKDVFFVTIEEVIEWMKNSGTVSEYSAQAKCKEIQQTKCAMDDHDDNLFTQFKQQCHFDKIGELDGQDKTLMICDGVSCPTHYPWVHREI